MKPDATHHDPRPEYLRLLIDESGLSQREIARRIGIDPRAIRYYVSGKPGKNGKLRLAPYPVQFALECLATDATGG